MPAAPDLTRLKVALEQMRSATDTGDRLTVATAHRRFHAEVVALGGNRQLTTVYESILVRLQLYMAVSLRREAEVAEAADGVHRHERLFQAVVDGDILDALTHHGARTYLS